MDSYQRFAPSPEFRPRAVADIAQAMQAQQQQGEQDLQRFSGQIEQRNQNRIEDTRFIGQDLTALAEFSKTALEFAKKRYERTIKDREIGAQFDSIYDPDLEIPEEVQTLLTGQNQQATAGEAANKIEASGDVLAAEDVRRDLNRIGQGLNDEKALLLSARGRFASEITALVNGNELSQLYAVDPAKALNIATKIWIEKNGLQYTTKANFVDVLGETIRSTTSYMATNQATERVRLQKQERLAEVKGTAFRVGRTATEADIGPSFISLSEQLYLDNNGITLRSTANRIAAQTMLAGAAVQSPDQVTLVSRALVVPDQKGTSIADTFPDLVYDAQEKAKKNQQIKLEENRRAVEAQLTEALSDPSLSLEERIQLVDQAATQLENDNGDFPGGQQIRLKTEAYVANPEATANFVRAQQRLFNGEGLTDEQITALGASGQLTPRQQSSLRQLRDQVFKTKFDEATAISRSNATLFTNTLNINSGLKLDPSTGNFIVGTKDSPLTGDQARYLNQEYKAKLSRHLKNKALNLGDVSEAEARTILAEEAAKFYDEQTQKPSGEFYLGGLFTAGGKLDPGTPEFQRVKNAARFLGVPTKPVPLGQNQNDWSSTYQPGVGATPEMIAGYKPGDKVLEQDEYEAFQAQIQQGQYSPLLLKLSRELKQTPLKFLQDQGKFYNGYTKPNENAFYNVSQNLTSSPEYLTENAVAGFRVLLNEGYSIQGAAMLAALAYTQFKANDKDGFKNGFGKNAANMIKDPLFKNPLASYRTLQAAINKGKYGTEVRNLAIQILRAAGAQ